MFLFGSLLSYLNSNRIALVCPMGTTTLQLGILLNTLQFIGRRSVSAAPGCASVRDCKIWLESLFPGAPYGAH